jgi:predicted RNA binding protein YcfA (HicA-like mRNA interferase family)
MPRRLRRLSGLEVVTILRRFGFDQVAGRGSHTKLRRDGPAGRQNITIPLHRELDSGTLHAIFRQASRFVPEDELSPLFFTED